MPKLSASHSYSSMSRNLERRLGLRRWERGEVRHEKGIYDAGDNAKLRLPMAFTATMLSWAILEYKDQIKQAKETHHAMDSLKWITDYLINAHPSPNLLYVQVGDPDSDHKCCTLDSCLCLRIPTEAVTVIASRKCGTTTTRAATATSSSGRRPGSTTLPEILHISDTLPYKGTTLLTGEQRRGLAGTTNSPELMCCCLDADGLIWVDEWNPLQYAVGSTFLALIYSDYMVATKTRNIYCEGELYEPQHVRSFAIMQADYVLGSNPMRTSNLVGYGSKYPEYVHHRGASIPRDATTGCSDGFKWLNSTAPNPNVAVGGGPFLNDTYIDSRNNTRQMEPTIYNTSLLVGLLSGLATTTSFLLINSTH
ncbi:hypothetical protein SASPL_145020 [Salvia splendens]|uniref:cellulase n=1 Tax=Salvia splendens TaxID=180675 RepID=A0A8X8Z7B5_SALSN|nr:hypothetical protein SASPL_145020 [Salvia splendens]